MAREPAAQRIYADGATTAAASPPPHLMQATHSPLQSLARSMQALRRVLANPLPHARRLARVIPTSPPVAPFPPLDKESPEGRHDYFADPREMLHTTAWALDMFCRPKRYREDTSRARVRVWPPCKSHPLARDSAV